MSDVKELREVFGQPGGQAEGCGFPVAHLLAAFCHRTGTLLEAARVVLERGAVAVEACVVHAVLSGRAVERLQTSPIRQLVVTDTIPLPAAKRVDRIEVRSVAGLLAEAIQAIHDGSSVSRLFR